MTCRMCTPLAFAGSWSTGRSCSARENAGLFFPAESCSGVAASRTPFNVRPQNVERAIVDDPGTEAQVECHHASGTVHLPTLSYGFPRLGAGADNLFVSVVSPHVACWQDASERFRHACDPV